LVGKKVEKGSGLGATVRGAEAVFNYRVGQGAVNHQKRVRLGWENPAIGCQTSLGQKRAF